MNITTVILQATTQIERLDAEALLCHLLQRERSYLRAWPEREIDAELNDQFQALITRRQQSEPLAYLIGWREFWSLRLNVTRATLIPRPDTELLVEQALARIPPASQWQIADLGTGSGAIALAIASERPHCQLTATDFSAAALAVATDNATQLGIHNIGFCHGSWCEALANNKYQMIVSNPPYIDGHDPHLQHDGLPFEPQSALTPGDDSDGNGLAALRLIIDQARAHLVPPGWLLLEHGYNQGKMVRELLQQAGYHGAITLQDLGGQERLTLAQLTV